MLSTPRLPLSKSDSKNFCATTLLSKNFLATTRSQKLFSLQLGDCNATLEELLRCNAAFEKLSRNEATLEELLRCNAAFEKLSRKDATLEELLRCNAAFEKLSRNDATLEELLRNNSKNFLATTRSQKLFSLQFGDCNATLEELLRNNAIFKKLRKLTASVLSLLFSDEVVEKDSSSNFQTLPNFNATISKNFCHFPRRNSSIQLCATIISMSSHAGKSYVSVRARRPLI